MKTHNEALLERVAEVMRPYLPPTRTDLLRNAVRAAIEALPARDEAAPASGVEAHPSMQTFDEGIDFALDRLCGFLGVDPAAVTWDAATETIEGDVSSVIGNILRAKFGEDWGPSAALASSTSAESAGGGVVAWFSTDADGDRAATVNSDTAERWRALGRTITALYASPPIDPETREGAIRADEREACAQTARAVGDEAKERGLAKAESRTGRNKANAAARAADRIEIAIRARGQ